MRSPILLLALLLFVPGASRLAAQTVVGRVLSADGPVRSAEVRLGEGPATATGADGRFVLRGTPGAHVLSVRSLGHVPLERRLELVSDSTIRLELRLETAALPIDPIVVTGTMKEVRVAESPVKVDVVTGRMLERRTSSSVMEAIGHINGLTEQVECGVCYTNSIRINGMEGPYTAVLIDGMPIMGALASVYGLNGIAPSLIERLEILKGPQSTLYGTEAMGGVVNVITKDPRFTPRWTLSATRTSLAEWHLEGGGAVDGEAGSAMLSGAIRHNDRFIDDNGDGFSDLTLDDRASLFAKGALRRDGREWLTLTTKLYREERFGGVESWTEADRGSDEVYGEFIRTTRAEALASALLPWEGVRAEGSWAWHDQDSWYGDQEFRAQQVIGYGTLLWDAPERAGHDVLVGATLRADSYDDDTPATATADRRLVPGLFIQDEWAVGAWTTLLGGLRVDRHGEHGAILSPRLSGKWSPREGTTLRLNFGTGFRVVHLFTEDHAALTGARDVVIEGDLAPERSWSVTGNVNQVLELGTNPMMIDLDVFHTRFSNKIRPDYDAHPDRIVYRNLEGSAVTRGISLALNQNVARDRFLYSLGVTLQDVHVVEGGERRDQSFSPRYTGVWTLSYSPTDAVTADWTGRLVGPMRLPEHPLDPSAPLRSDPYAVHDLQLTVGTGGGTQVVLALQNAFDFTQGSPLIDPGRPFGEDFDTVRVWGPVVGRKLVIGVRLAGER